MKTERVKEREKGVAGGVEGRGGGEKSQGASMHSEMCNRYL